MRNILKSMAVGTMVTIPFIAWGALVIAYPTIGMIVAAFVIFSGAYYIHKYT